MKKDKIFISHSSKDANFIKSFVENVLILGLEISSIRIFCSSIEGQGVKSGQYIPDRLRREINRSSLALLFISKSYKNSEVCLNEVGAAWATLSKENVIPLLMPDVDFNELGILDFNRLGLRVYERSDVLKLIQDCKEKLNPSFNVAKLHDKIEVFLRETQTVLTPEQFDEDNEPPHISEWKDCFTNNLYALDTIIRRAIPAKPDGIHKIEEVRLQNQILTDLSKAQFLKTFWYKMADGDFYVESLKKLPSGTWLISDFNWEIKISEMWVSMDTELQYEFILIHSEKQDEIKIDSDEGGRSHRVGIMNDGTVVSELERRNGFAFIQGESVDLHEIGVEPRIRDEKAHWIFLVSSYHKAGFNADATIDFCKKIDSGEIEVNNENIFQFLWKLPNHPIVSTFR